MSGPPDTPDGPNRPAGPSGRPGPVGPADPTVANEIAGERTERVPTGLLDAATSPAEPEVEAQRVGRVHVRARPPRFPIRRSTLLLAVAFVGFGILLYLYPPPDRIFAGFAHHGRERRAAPGGSGHLDDNDHGPVQHDDDHDSGPTSAHDHRPFAHDDHHDHHDWNVDHDNPRRPPRPRVPRSSGSTTSTVGERRGPARPRRPSPDLVALTGQGEVEEPGTPEVLAVLEELAVFEELDVLEVPDVLEVLDVLKPVSSTGAWSSWPT